MIRPGPDLMTSITRVPELDSASVKVPLPAAEQQVALQGSLSQLQDGKKSLASMPLRRRIELLEQCVEGIAGAAHDWVDAACVAKGIPAGSRCRAEEVLGGPTAAMRQLQLYLRTMREIERTGSPAAPKIVRHPDGKRVGVRVMPCAGLYDWLAFINFSATTWMQPGIAAADVLRLQAPVYRDLGQTGLSVVLGAGNVAGIPATDMLSKLCLDNRAVLLKMNPVNEYLAPFFERAFAPLIENNLLRVITGDAHLASAAIMDPRVDDVHITGSDKTHAAIVWGQSAEERERRQRAGQPLLTKTINSELGNVTPWIVVPGAYSSMQLQAQVENIVTSLTNNAAFNCIATRVIVTWKQWPERERFLQRIESELSRIPQRKAYYPGAFERYERFVGQSVAESQKLLRSSGKSLTSATGSKSRGDGSLLFVAGTEARDDAIPWTIVRNVNPQEPALLLKEESFVNVCAEVPIDATSPEDFLIKAAAFANEKLWGTLAASITLPSDFRRRATGRDCLRHVIDELNYGIVGLNHWSGIAFALMSIPWGGAPGATLSNPQSGTGWVHNSLMLTGIQKTVLDGPLVVLPKPVWVPSHQRPESVAWALFDVFKAPNYWNANRLTFAAIRGALARSP